MSHQPTRSEGTKLTTTSQTTVFTAVGGNMRETLVSVMVANLTPTDATVPANGSVWLRPINIPLDASDAIKATAGTANALRVVTMVNEMARESHGR